MREGQGAGAGSCEIAESNGAGGPGKEDTAAAPRSFPPLAPTELLAARFGQAAGTLPPAEEGLILPGQVALQAQPLSNQSTAAEPSSNGVPGSIPSHGPPPHPGHRAPIGSTSIIPPYAPSQLAQAGRDGSTAAHRGAQTGMGCNESAWEGSMEQDRISGPGMDIGPGAGIGGHDTDASGGALKDGSRAPTVTMNPAGASWRVPQQVLEATAGTAKGTAGECGDDVQGKNDSGQEASMGKPPLSPPQITVQSLKLSMTALHPTQCIKACGQLT